MSQTDLLTKYSKKMTTLTKKINERTERFNKEFLGMSAKRKRITIAQDVIAQIKANYITPTTGTYLRAKGEASNYYSDLLTYENAKADVQKLLGIAEQCNACAIGSMFVCDVLKTDRIKTDSVGDVNSNRMRKKLEKYFDMKQLYLIECAFEKEIIEGKNYLEKKGTLTALAIGAIRFGKKYDTDKRLVAIMKNIIKNNGTFKP